MLMFFIQIALNFMSKKVIIKHGLPPPFRMQHISTLMHLYAISKRTMRLIRLIHQINMVTITAPISIKNLLNFKPLIRSNLKPPQIILQISPSILPSVHNKMLPNYARGVILPSF